VTTPALSAALLLAAVVATGAQSWKNTAPEAFRANAQVAGEAGGIGAVIGIRVQRYCTDAERDRVAGALKDGGYAAFLTALRASPVIGSVTVGERTIPIRWATQTPSGKGRRIVVVTDAPVYFVGAGAVNAPSTEGFDVAIAEFTVDSVGLGSGTMAAAARVRSGGPAGVEVEDYAGKRITLVTVTRELK
jgi:hypothetical protein